MVVIIEGARPGVYKLLMHIPRVTTSSESLVKAVQVL